MRVLVAEKIGVSGVELLRAHGFEVDEGPEHLERLGDYDGLLIRSATKVTADVLAGATNLKAIGRAGVGVDNVDVEEATKRGIIVANAPESNVVTAAEHTMALLLALARNVPQAHASLKAGRWDRAKYSGVELHEKVLGVVGFGRIGQLVAARARGFGMRVVAYDPFVSADRFRDAGVEHAATPDAVYAVADFLTLHLPKTPETEGWLDAAALAKCKDGVRVLNVARGPLVVDEDLQAALDSGKVAGAALDVFRSEPVTEHPLFHYDNVIVTPHLGASTAEATDRAGYQAAEQVVAALTGGPVTTAVNVPAVAGEDLEVLGPYLPLARMLGRLAAALVGGVEEVHVECLGRIAERDTRPVAVAALLGVLSHTADDVNQVNAPAIARARGISVVETNRSQARDYNDVVRVTVRFGERSERAVGTNVGQHNTPTLIAAWGQKFNLQIENHVALFRYRDVPGMIGRVGTVFGQHGINITAASVGFGGEGEAVMALTTETAVPQSVVDDIVSTEGFRDGRAVSML
ncbi:MAG TPA: phosphoglycerate dehydrogenase [Solirubrobacteraceae bacterium]|nr:phosphoglycerate dehydrogenase [Solirubrobacteraceae bacterium]